MVFTEFETRLCVSISMLIYENVALNFDTSTNIFVAMKVWKDYDLEVTLDVRTIHYGKGTEVQQGTRDYLRALGVIPIIDRILQELKSVSDACSHVLAHVNGGARREKLHPLSTRRI